MLRYTIGHPQSRVWTKRLLRRQCLCMWIARLHTRSRNLFSPWVTIFTPKVCTRWAIQVGTRCGRTFTFLTGARFKFLGIRFELLIYSLFAHIGVNVLWSIGLWQPWLRLRRIWPSSSNWAICRWSFLAIRCVQLLQKIFYRQRSGYTFCVHWYNHAGAIGK